MNILLLSPGGAFASALESLPLDRDRDRVTLVTAVASDAQDASPLIRLGAAALPSRSRLARALESSVIGRNIKRLSPLDGSRRFAAAARRSAELRRAVAQADLIVALERDSVLAAWKALHGWAPAGTRGVFGLAPARALLTSRRRAV
ncbi:hypothetical protein O5Y58_03860 [Microbacterium paraoxydans]|uniref:hypothetical protein n=1 Tax=Microbacterium paraoxydans TaxID=199592 RepID=UPI00352FD4FC